MCKNRQRNREIEKQVRIKKGFYREVEEKGLSLQEERKIQIRLLLSQFKEEEEEKSWFVRKERKRKRLQLVKVVLVERSKNSKICNEIITISLKKKEKRKDAHVEMIW